jgi:hypothetical protein
MKETSQIQALKECLLYILKKITIDNEALIIDLNEPSIADFQEFKSMIGQFLACVHYFRDRKSPIFSAADVIFFYYDLGKKIRGGFTSPLGAVEYQSPVKTITSVYEFPPSMFLIRYNVPGKFKTQWRFVDQTSTKKILPVQKEAKIHIVVQNTKGSFNSNTKQYKSVDEVYVTIKEMLNQMILTWMV